MTLRLNYRHLYYFWVVAKEGGISRAAAKLDVAVQTISAQVRELEQSLGRSLLKPAGRGLALTDAGVVAMRQADAIFQLGEQLFAQVRDAGSAQGMRLAVGAADNLPKLVVRHLMEPVLAQPDLRLLFHEDEFERLLGDLALHRLDVVLADRPAPANPNLKLYSHALASSALAWFGTPELAKTARRGFPQSLERVPVLLPTRHAAARDTLDAWFERHGLRPRIAGEFQDSALLKTFAASGMGVAPAPVLITRELAEHHGLVNAGDCDGVEERLYAIGAERKVTHPLVQALLGQRPVPS